MENNFAAGNARCFLEKRFQHGLSFFSILPNELRNEIKNMLPTNETILLWILKDMADDEKWNNSCQGIFHQLPHTIQILRKALANLNPESTSGATQKIYQQVKLILQEQGGGNFLEDIFALEKKLETNTQALRS